MSVGAGAPSGNLTMNSISDNVKPKNQHKWYEDTLEELEIELAKIECLLLKRLETLEKSVSLPQDEQSSPAVRSSILKTTHRIIVLLKHYIQAEDVNLKENSNLKIQLKHQQYLLKEVEMERDILLQQVQEHLETNSSLRVRLEEQRCQAGTSQRQGNVVLELRIKSLESENEKLMEWNQEKDNRLGNITLTLEKAMKALQEKETEALNWKNEKKNLKADLRKVSEEKAKIEEKYAVMKKQFQNISKNLKGLGEKKSLSEGNLTRSVSFIEANTAQKSVQGFTSTLELFKNSEGSRKFDVKTTPVQSQLNSLRRDLLNVTSKLEALKLQLVNSGVIPEERQPSKNLKRKANPMDEVTDDQKSEFKNLKHILQDAKNLNAKLQNMREEKQKFIEDRAIESNKKEGGVAEKENEYGLTAHTIGIFKIYPPR